MSNFKRLWAFDFDGTLSDIVPDPATATINSSCEQMIQSLSKEPGAIVAVLSSRRTADIKDRINVPGVNIGGCSGLEWIIPGKGVFRRNLDPERIRHSRYRALLALKQLKNIYGVIVEDKYWSVTIHFKKAGTASVEQVGEILNSKPLHDFRKYSGPDAVEIQFSRFGNKAFGLRYLCELLNYSPSPGSITYSGDDENDASAMKWVLERKGTAITVGRLPLVRKSILAESPADLAAEVLKLSGLTSSSICISNQA